MNLPEHGHVLLMNILSAAQRSGRNAGRLLDTDVLCTDRWLCNFVLLCILKELVQEFAHVG